MTTEPAQVGILRDPIWQFIGALLAIVALILSVYIYIQQRQEKRLQITVLTNTSVFDIRPDMEGDITVQYEGRPVKDVVLFKARIENTGSLPILEEDYYGPFLFFFNRDFYIAHISIDDASWVGKRPGTRPILNEVQIVPVLLNPGDWYTITFTIISEKKGIPVDFTVSGRIVGAKQVEVLSSPVVQAMPRQSERLPLLVIVVLAGSLIVCSLLPRLPQLLSKWKSSTLPR